MFDVHPTPTDLPDCYSKVSFWSNLRNRVCYEKYGTNKLYTWKHLGFIFKDTHIPGHTAEQQASKSTKDSVSYTKHSLFLRV